MNKRDFELTAALAKTDVRCNHVLHIILSVLTAGLWIPVWFIVAMMAATKRDNAQRRVDILMGDLK